MFSFFTENGLLKAHRTEDIKTKCTVSMSRWDGPDPPAASWHLSGHRDGQWLLWLRMGVGFTSNWTACFPSHLPVIPCSGREVGDSALACPGKSFPPASPEDITPYNREAVPGPPPPPLNTLPAWSVETPTMSTSPWTSLLRGHHPAPSSILPFMRGPQSPSAQTGGSQWSPGP